MTAPKEICTEHLRLSCWQEGDAEELRACLDRCDAHLRPWIPFMQYEPRTLEQTRKGLGDCRSAFDKGEHYRFAIRKLDSNTLIGETMLFGRGGPSTLEAGYWLDQQHCGKGYATEATQALLPLAFGTLSIGRVIMRCDQRNVASVRVAERLGGICRDIETLVENSKAVTLLVFECKPPTV
ncbi:MAG: RimJ/RimL family protein N-acetyltransferase [Planctomycetota bacterium]|jgi:RimJ/RimL family protein N-acetyltransferase